MTSSDSENEVFEPPTKRKRIYKATIHCSFDDYDYKRLFRLSETLFDIVMKRIESKLQHLVEYLPPPEIFQIYTRYFEIFGKNF